MASLENTLKEVFREIKTDIDRIENNGDEIYIFLKNSYSYGHIYALGFKVIRKLAIKGVKAEFEKPIEIKSRDSVLIKIKNNNDNDRSVYIVSG